MPQDIFQQISSQQAPPTQPQSGGDIFGQLASGTYKDPQPAPSDAQIAYRKATASGPYAPAGVAERAIGQQFGDNTGQAIQAAKSTGEAALQTASGMIPGPATGEAVMGAVNAAAKSSTPYVIKAGEWAAMHPVLRSILVETIKNAAKGTAIAAGYKFGKGLLGAATK